MVELGVRMVPLVLGTKYKALLQVLRKHCIDADRLTFDGSNHLPVPEPGTRPFFFADKPSKCQRATQISIAAQRIRSQREAPCRLTLSILMDFHPGPLAVPPT